MCITNGLIELVLVSMREVFRGGIRDFHELLFVLCSTPEPEKLIDDFARMVSSREEEKDLALFGLEVDAGCVDASPDVPG